MADEPEFAERPQLYCQLFVPCHTIWYDAGRPEEGYRIGRVMCVVTPAPGAQYPSEFPRLFGYAQLYGAEGEHSVRVLLVRVAENDEGDEVTSMLGEYGEFGTFGPWVIERINDDFVSEFGFPLDGVILPTPGVYEFQLWRDDNEDDHELLFRVRIWAKEPA